MPKYWGGKYFAHGSFPEVGQMQKTEKKRKERRKKDRKLVIIMAKLCMAHASTQAAWAKTQEYKKYFRNKVGGLQKAFPIDFFIMFVKLPFAIALFYHIYLVTDL